MFLMCLVKCLSSRKIVFHHFSLHASKKKSSFLLPPLSLLDVITSPYYSVINRQMQFMMRIARDAGMNINIKRCSNYPL